QPVRGHRGTGREVIGHDQQFTRGHSSTGTGAGESTLILAHEPAAGRNFSESRGNRRVVRRGLRALAWRSGPAPEWTAKSDCCPVGKSVVTGLPTMHLRSAIAPEWGTF